MVTKQSAASAAHGNRLQPPPASAPKPNRMGGNIKANDWSLIHQHVRRLDKENRGWEIFIRGHKKDHKNARRNMCRAQVLDVEGMRTMADHLAFLCHS